eukprot:2195696-Rhodomonas_salina.2
MRGGDLRGCRRRAPCLPRRGAQSEARAPRRGAGSCTRARPKGLLLACLPDCAHALQDGNEDACSAC